MRIQVWAAVLALAVCAAPVQAADVQAILKERVDTARRGVGLVVGELDAQGARITAYGKTAADGVAVDGDTLFEVGSVSKVFTATLLADMVRRGEVRLDEPISGLLPAGVKAPSRNGKEITLADLASHRSGLPRLPDNMAPKDRRNPYADYGPEQLYAFLNSHTLAREPGEKYEYSNLGAGLLGHLLSLRAGKPYAQLLKERIFDPLGMQDTTVVLSPALAARMARGHDPMLRPTANWDMDALAGAGAVRSTVKDMLKFLAAEMGLKPAPVSLAAAMQDTQAARAAAGSEAMQIGLGWHILQRNGLSHVWHNGQSGGFHSFIGFDKAAQKGVVVLGNAANDYDDIGRHLLSETFPLAKAEPPPVAITLTPAQLDAYVGRYQIVEKVFIEVTREGERLFMQVTNQSKVPLQAKSDGEFFLGSGEVKLVFEKDAGGKIVAASLRQGPRENKAKRVE
ncbi:serine hydrolase [Massilia sp. TS11]|uniref:serine hydrolase n=1 Tax=Massilia sp. TS11 TaxID=2908003 RepID=UPI001EDBA07C|nr:serine hydrolase [Massilia sp. TS11]MCG2583646.1 serine hydrolase [Massilia sp. TS11]